jgi:hypothetical protein
MEGDRRTILAVSRAGPRHSVEIQPISWTRTAVSEVLDYHVTTQKALAAFLAAGDNARKTIKLKIEGVRPAFFEDAAWDLAVTTQSLTYLDADLALKLSKIYKTQQAYSGLSTGLTQAMYLQPPGSARDAGSEPFMRALNVYYGDITLLEPNLMKKYDEVLPLIDRALGESNPAPAK